MAGFTPEQLRKLARLSNRQTLYEAVVIRSDGTRKLLAYVGRHSKRGLAAAVDRRGHAVVRFLGVNDDAVMAGTRGKPGLAITGGGRVEFSGRTQRDAIIEGELPYVDEEGKRKRAAAKR